MRVALVSREVYPFGGGGIGQFVAAAARVLSQIAEVTVLSTSVFLAEYERLRELGDQRLVPGVRYAFVEEPSVEETLGWYHVMHLYGARMLATLKELFPDGGPELIEFPDFLGEAFVPLQAARALDPFFSDTRLCVRIHTTAEVCEVLDGFYKRDPASAALHAMERFALANADRLIWQGGDILNTYRGFYGSGGLAPDLRIRYPYRGPVLAAGEESVSADGPLQILYAGRLERRKGVHNLIRALTGMARDDFHLTLHGGDTPTAPLGMSMREHLELMIADDPRITLGGTLDRDGLEQAIRAHHLVVIPSLWECWPFAALEALHLNRPVLATPVGGLSELVKDGRSGWLAEGTGPTHLEAVVDDVLAHREAVFELSAGGLPLDHARSLADDGDILADYQSLHALPTGRSRGSTPPAGKTIAPLVSAIVPYYRSWAYVQATVESLLEQTYPRIEIVLVNDGSFEDEDWVLAELAGQLPLTVVTQMNQGLGAARNFGISQSRGRYLFPLDADNLAEPTFVSRSVEILEQHPEVAYVTSWTRYLEADGTPRGGLVEGYQPLGNHAEMLSADNVAGDAAAVLRRRLFDAGFRYSEELTSYEDWHFYRELQRAGHIGAVIPERLLRYRVRADSMQAEVAQPNRARLEGEMEALMRESALKWTSSNV
jgi:glycogen(starch) synthase